MKKLLFSCVFLSSFIAILCAQDEHPVDHDYFFTPDEIAWRDGPPTLPPGPKFQLLEGSIHEEGPIIIRLWLPPGYVIPPHSHPGMERSTVLSGKYHMGIGETFDMNNTTAMPSGSLAIIPAGGIPHFGKAVEETVIQVQMQGPLQIDYVDPADDPRINGADK